MTPSDVGAPANRFSQPHSRLLVIWELLVHVCVGSALFVIIYMPAVGLAFLVKWMLGLGLNDPWLTAVLQVAKYSLVVADTVLLLVFLAKTVWRTAKAL